MALSMRSASARPSVRAQAAKPGTCIDGGATGDRDRSRAALTQGRGGGSGGRGWHCLPLSLPFRPSPISPNTGASRGRPGMNGAPSAQLGAAGGSVDPRAPSLSIKCRRPRRRTYPSQSSLLLTSASLQKTNSAPLHSRVRPPRRRGLRHAAAGRRPPGPGRGNPREASAQEGEALIGRDPGADLPPPLSLPLSPCAPAAAAAEGHLTWLSCPAPRLGATD
jgi:hypothetical protein